MEILSGMKERSVVRYEWESAIRCGGRNRGMIEGGDGRSVGEEGIVVCFEEGGRNRGGDAGAVCFREDVGGLLRGRCVVGHDSPGGGVGWID